MESGYPKNARAHHYQKIKGGNVTSRDNLCPNVVQVNLKIWSELKLHGVEMEALTAVQVALLTIYDMCKAVDRSMVMGDVKLLKKSGGKSGEWKAPE